MQNNDRFHSETVNFLKRYFDFESLIPIDSFIERVVQEFGDLWNNESDEHLIEGLSWKVIENFGENIDPRDLLVASSNNGMIGLILQFFKSMKD